MVTDALGRGAQIFILRKGGIHEGRGGFQVEHSEFLLFPTLFHQQREAVVEPAQARYDQLAPNFPPEGRLRLDYWARVMEWREITSPRTFEKLRGQHVWRDEVLQERFEWGQARGIFAIIVRVHRLPTAVELPMVPKYGGCKSWVELLEDVDLSGSSPALNQGEFGSKLERFRHSLL